MQIISLSARNSKAYFLGKDKKTIISLASTELAQRMENETQKQCTWYTIT